MINGILIYFIGYLISYCIYSRDYRKHVKQYSWEEVKKSAMISIFSWISVIIALIAFIHFALTPIVNKVNKYLENTKPPKWL